MQTHLNMVVKVPEGVEANTTAELKGGDFDIHSIEHLPLKWEAPYWIHEIKATLSSRLPGSYTLPKHTLYLVSEDGTERVQSPELKIQVHGLMKEKNVTRDLLKDVEPSTEEKKNPWPYELVALVPLLGFCLYKIFNVKIDDEDVFIQKKKTLPTMSEYR